ncbi:hypothetical protein L249_4379 [Ophiocordyceps polyrhachis-furcata BCC 54312]|uniref:Uncharacterized protein n=1 Tax=Ophiocordyceps polyrhachis-furcata BCC 54312 TaxID=1330021 RepID=A0A367L7G3_9HYPO|nr:hypothetical protein L249_4379 [Ophiocordyceps polyrhachis-furcata BCC 54312]
METEFSRHGDSGSVVFNHSVEAIGLLWGGKLLQQTREAWTLVTPIEDEFEHIKKLSGGEEVGEVRIASTGTDTEAENQEGPTPERDPYRQGDINIALIPAEFKFGEVDCRTTRDDDELGRLLPKTYRHHLPSPARGEVAAMDQDMDQGDINIAMIPAEFKFGEVDCRTARDDDELGRLLPKTYQHHLRLRPGEKL